MNKKPNNFGEILNKSKVEELFYKFLAYLGFIYFAFNVIKLFWVPENVPFGGFLGQCIFASIVAFSSTYLFKPKVNKENSSQSSEDIKNA